MNEYTGFYTPQPQPLEPMYTAGQTYMIDGYRMYLHTNGDWYYVDHPGVPPLRAARPHYRTGGVPGILFKIIGVMSLIAGIGMMFGEEDGFVIAGAFLLTIGLFGTIFAIVDSVRNHPTAWKVGATVAAGALVYSQVSKAWDDD